MTYISPDIIDDETQVAEATLAGVADRIDGWAPAEGGLATPVCEATAIAIATAVSVLKATVLDAYLGFGTRILNLPRTPATLATAVSTWTVVADALTELPAGSEVDVLLIDGTTGTMVVSETVTVPAAATTVTGVVLEAIESGPDYNGATNPATPSLVGVTAVSIDAPAANGADAQDPDDYVNTIADRATRLHAVPISPSDHAAFATDVAAVGRAVALNRYDPSFPLADSPGHMGLVMVHADGSDLSGPEEDEVQAYFDSIERALNVTLHMLSPARVSVAVAATVVSDGTIDDDVLEASVVAAIVAASSPANWDADADEPGGFKKAQARHTELTVFDISAAIDDLEGLAAVTDVTLNGDTDPIALPAPVSLPELSGAPTVTIA